MTSRPAPAPTQSFSAIGCAPHLVYLTRKNKTRTGQINTPCVEVQCQCWKNTETMTMEQAETWAHAHIADTRTTVVR